MTNLHDMTNAELVGVYNALALSADRPTLSAWKRDKQTLVDRIEALRAEVEQAEDLDELIADVAEMPREDFEAGLEALKQERATEEPHQVDAVPSAVDDDHPDEDMVDEPTAPGRTIRAAAIDLLCRVEYYEDRNKKAGPDNRVEKDAPGARSVGLAYDDIIAAIQGEFDGCKTTVACLRWYSVKIRVEEHGYEGLRLPQRRPRAKPSTAA